MRLFILSLVIWRLSFMLTEESAPFQALDWLREKTNDWRFIDLDCFYCISVVVSLFLYIIGSAGFYEALALSSIAIFIENIHQRIK